MANTAIAAQALARETARRETEAADAAWRAALESQRRTAFVAEAGPDETVIVTAVANVPAVAEPLNPVGAILDALPEQILAWYRTEELDPATQAATDRVLDGLGDSLLDHFRASQGRAEPDSEEATSDQAARIAA